LRQEKIYFVDQPGRELFLIQAVTLLSNLSQDTYRYQSFRQNPRQALVDLVTSVLVHGSEEDKQEVEAMFGKTPEEITFNVGKYVEQARRVFEVFANNIALHKLRGKKREQMEELLGQGNLTRVIEQVEKNRETQGLKALPKDIKQWLFQVSQWFHVFEVFDRRAAESRVEKARDRFYDPHKKWPERVQQIFEGGQMGVEEYNKLAEELGLPPLTQEQFERVVGRKPPGLGSEYMWGIYSSERIYQFVLEDSGEVRKLQSEILEVVRGNEALQQEVLTKLAALGVDANEVLNEGKKEFYLVKALVSVYNSWVAKRKPDTAYSQDLNRIITKLNKVFFQEIGLLMMVHGVGGGGEGLNNKAQLEVSVLFLLLPTQSKAAVKGMVKGISLMPKLLKATISQMSAERLNLYEDELNAVQTLKVEVGKAEEEESRWFIHFSDFLTAWELAPPVLTPEHQEIYRKSHILPKNVELYILSTDVEEKDALIQDVINLTIQERGINPGDLTPEDKLRLKFMAKGSLAWLINTMVGYRALLGYYGLHKHKIKALRAFRLYLQMYGGPASYGEMVLGMETIGAMVDRELKGGKKMYFFNKLASELTNDTDEQDIIIRALQHLFFEETQPDNPVLRPIADVRAFGAGGHVITNQHGIRGFDGSYEYLWKDKSVRRGEEAKLTGFFDDPQMASDLRFLFDKLRENPAVAQRLKTTFNIDDAEVARLRDQMIAQRVEAKWYTNQAVDTANQQRQVIESVALVRAMMKHWTWRLVGNKKLAEGIYDAYVEFGSNTVFDQLRYQEALEAVSNYLFQFSSRPTESLLFKMHEVLAGTTLGDPGTQIFMKPFVDHYIEWHKGRKMFTMPWNHHEKLDWNMPMKLPLDGLTLPGTDIPVTETAQVNKVDPLTGLPQPETTTLKEVSDARNDWFDRLSIRKRALPFIGGDGVSLMHIIHGKYWADDKYVLNKYDIMKKLDEYRGRGLITSNMVRELAYKHVGRIYYWKYNLGLHWLEFDNLLKAAALMTGVAAAGVAINAITAKKS